MNGQSLLNWLWVNAAANRHTGPRVGNASQERTIALLNPGPMLSAANNRHATFHIQQFTLEGHL